MITFTTGDIFQGEHEVLVNDVNCAGNMDIGAGAVFREKYPNMFRQYEKLCGSRIIRPGNTWVYETSRDMPRYIFNAATQGGSGLGHQVLSIDSFPDRRQEGH